MEDMGGGAPQGSLEYRSGNPYAQPETILADDPSLSGIPGPPSGEPAPMNTGYGPGNYPPPPADHASPGSYGYGGQPAQPQPQAYQAPQPPAQQYPGQQYGGQQFQPAPSYPPAGAPRQPAIGGASGRIVVDMHAPTMDADQLEAAPNYPVPAAPPGQGGFAPPPQPIPVADPHNGAAPPADDPQTAQLYEWLGRRGIGPAYFSSYVRARNIIWGGDPGGPVDPEDLERALAARASRATPKQLANLRDLGSLLTQYYGVQEATAAPAPQAVPPAVPQAAPQAAPQPTPQPTPGATAVPATPLSRRAAHVAPVSSAAPAPVVPDSSSGPVLTADDLLDDSADIAVQPRRTNPHPTTDIPVELDVEPQPTPVPVLLEESAVDMRIDRPAMEVDNESTGATPLVSLEREEEKPEAYPDSPSWSLPQGFASAWDPRTRDQRPNEVLRPPRSPLLTFGVPVVLLLVIAVVLYFALGG